MKVRNTVKPYAEVAAMKRPVHKKPQKTNMFFRTLLKLVSLPDLVATRFKCRKVGMERLGKNEPALIFMNHSSFIDLEIASSVLYPRPFNIVATLDAFIGKEWLMRQIGCIPTRKFVFDLGLVRDITHCIRKLKTSVLMYPEAGYTFDGTATTMPESLGKFVKMLGAPLVMLETYGAFHRQPLYNELRRRKVRVSAELRYVLSADEIAKMSAEEIGEVIAKEFSFDAFRWQRDNSIKIDDPERAVGLDRLLYKCPNCGSETGMMGEGVHIKCADCGKKWELTEYGAIVAETGKTEFEHIPDWYEWERVCVREELASDKYGYEIPVDIYMIVNASGVYKVGTGTLAHSKQGFHLVGCDGQIDYKQNSVSLYTLNADYYWYGLGDVIGIGNHDALYYCIPTEHSHTVTKSRLATEEIYKTLKN
jgi:hypothetical protein